MKVITIKLSCGDRPRKQIAAPKLLRDIMASYLSIIFLTNLSFFFFITTVELFRGTEFASIKRKRNMHYLEYCYD